MGLRIGADLHPATQDEAEAFQARLGLAPQSDAPRGFAPVAALWARERDMVVGQGAILVCEDAQIAGHLRPDALSPLVPVALIDRLGVLPEWREIGVEERLVRALIRRLPGIGEALVYVGAAHAPVLRSTLDGLGPRRADEVIRGAAGD